jgi:hypothetical protein
VARREGLWIGAGAKLKAAAAMELDGGSVREARTADPPAGGLGSPLLTGWCRCSIQSARGSSPGRRPRTRPAGNLTRASRPVLERSRLGVEPAQPHGGVNARMNGARVGFTAARALNSLSMRTGCGQVHGLPDGGTDSCCVRLVRPARPLQADDRHHADDAGRTSAVGVCRWFCANWWSR